MNYANTTGGVFDAVLKRGFGKNRDGSIMRNGTPVGVRHSFNPSVETAEVLKGPASLLYGVQDPGGVINLVTKKPLYEPRYEIYGGFGNHSYYNAGFDATGAFGESGFAYRLIVDRSSKHYWREYGKYTSTFIAPSISYKGDDYRIDVAYTHGKYNDVLDRGMIMYVNKANPAWDDKFITSDRKRRLDEPFNQIEGKVDTFDVNFEKHLGENWLLKASYAYTHSMHDYDQMRVRGFNPNTGMASRENSYYHDFKHQTSAGSVNLNGIVETGEISHNLLFGLDAQKEYRKRPGSVRVTAGVPSINVNRPVHNAPKVRSPM